MKTKVYPVGFRNVVKSLLVCFAFWMIPSIAKADTPIPTSIVTNYNAALQRLTVTVQWSWGSTSSSKHVGAALFADLNGDGITPTIFDNPATYNSGGNPFPAGLQARDEFLGQLAVSNIEGSASSSMFAGTDNTDNGIASGVSGVTTTTARMLLPYLGNSMSVVNSSTGTFTLTYNNVTVSPTRICVVLYDPHSPFTSSGGHSIRSAGPGYNTDNSVEDGNNQGTVSCTTLVGLNCAVNKTEAPCQTQAAINASYNTWLASATASGCNGVLTNDNTGAPSACGGSKTVTWTYTQNGCPNQAQVTTCTATFTVTADNTAPVFTSCPAGANLGCNPSGQVPPPGNATATDNCGNPIITNNLGPVIVNGSQRTQTRTYTATDACGNSSTCQQVFTWSICPVYNPDINATFVNVSVGGNVSTNDVVPSGTAYGTTPTPLAGNPPGGTLVMNSNGTYTFVSPNVGVYKYHVPVCIPGAVAPCPNTLLTITVLGPNLNNNPPVANTDIAITLMNTPVTIQSLANDKAGNPGGALVPGSVIVTVAAMNGTTTVDLSNGNTTYTPNLGFTGQDTLTYRVCDNSNPTPLCATALQIITVRANGGANTTLAADDYNSTTLNTAVSGNVRTNDTDPEGHSQTVTVQNTTVPGKGTLVLLNNGNYTFTPVNGFSGPVNFVYTTCDNGAPIACANATLYILVRPAQLPPDLTPNITAIPNVMHGTTEFSVTVRVTELLGNSTDGSEILVRIPKDPRVSFTYNSNLIVIGFTPLNNNIWTYDGTNAFFHIFKTNAVITGNSFSTFGFMATFTPGQTAGKYTLTSALNSGSGGELITTNNQDAEVIDYFIN